MTPSEPDASLLGMENEALYRTPNDYEVDRVARLLMEAWEVAEGYYPTASYVATFTDMARVVVDEWKETIKVLVEARLTNEEKNV